MNNSIAMLIIGLFFGGGIGFLTAASSGVTLDGHDHSTGHMDGSQTALSQTMDHQSAQHMNHDEIVVLADGMPQPTLSVEISPDPVSGWNLKLVTTNFTFAPENASLAHRDGEGHAHVYVNGVKIARLYGPWMHIAALPEGENTVEVTLNSNDHRQLATGNNPLRAKTTVSVN